ncbi:MAG: hypothetical protein IKC63_06360 [Clostridia bacterium]|nr:hypothetical protein [Clostridia bacterium]
MKHTQYNPYGIHERTDAFKKFGRILVWGGGGGSLVLFFLLYQLLVANGAPSWLCLAAHYLTQAFSVFMMFGIMALTVIATAHEESALRKSLLLQEIAALFSLSLILRMALYFLTALIDASFDLGGFYLNDVTLSFLTEAYGFQFLMSTLSAFLGVLSMSMVLLLSAYLIKRLYRKAATRGAVSDAMKKAPVLVYLAVSGFFALINTVMTVIDLGFSLDFSVIFSLLLPYLEIALFTLLGYYVISEITARWKS